jgi:hypothetical protein
LTRRYVTAVIACTTALLVSSSALAESREAAASVLLVVQTPPAGVSVEAMRAAIGEELGVPIELAEAAPTAGRGALVLRVDSARAHRVILTYHAPDGRVNERAVDVPPREATRTIEIVVLLAGNLVRDEAAELAALLRPKGAEAELDEPPESTPSESTPSESTPSESTPSESTPSESKPPSTAQNPPPVRRSTPAPPRATERRKPPATIPSACAHSAAKTVIASADVLPFIGTSTVTGVDHTRNLSISVLGGWSTGVRGVTVSNGFNIATEVVCGVQLTGGVNVSAGPVQGLQLGGVNVSGPLEGTQAGIGVNVATEVRGLQLGGVNVATRSAYGAQAGGVNIAVDELVGVQIGAVNVAAGGVKGVQIGAINVASESTLSLGLINILPRGRVHIDAWGTESGLMMLGVKNGGRYFHNIYGAGVLPAAGHVELAFAFGMGVHLPIPVTSGLFVDVDLLGYSLHSTDSPLTPSTLVQARALLGVPILRRLAFYVGPSVTMHLSIDPQMDAPSLIGSFQLHENASGYALRAMWPGVTVGLQAL